MRLLYDRMGQGRLIVCCGPFVDDQHHVPPFHAVFTGGFGGIRADLAAGRLTEAEAKRPVDQFLIVSECHLDNKTPEIRFGPPVEILNIEKS